MIKLKAFFLTCNGGWLLLSTSTYARIILMFYAIDALLLLNIPRITHAYAQGTLT